MNLRDELFKRANVHVYYEVKGQLYGWDRAMTCVVDGTVSSLLFLERYPQTGFVPLYSLYISYKLL